MCQVSNNFQSNMSIFRINIITHNKQSGKESRIKVSKDEESRRGKAKNSPLAVIFFIVYAISTTFSVFSLE